MYSSAFKRLVGVTQVASASAGYVFHTRLTHSLQVAQVGRRLAEKLAMKQRDLAGSLGGIDPNCVETACLAHDIGHPPFGHLAEEVLDEKSDSFGGFEGNAQTFRILSQLSVRNRSYQGLNLTRKSLQATLKYPWLYTDRPPDPTHRTGRKAKWGAYDCDGTDFAWVWKNQATAPIKQRTPEAEIMDWADDVTYSVHDVEDFFRAGLIPLHLLKSYGSTGERGQERARFFDYVVAKSDKDRELLGLTTEDIAGILDDLLIYAEFSFEQPYEGSREDHAGLRTFTSRLISRFINSLQLREPDASDSSTVIKDPLARQEIAILKQLTWFYVIDAPALALQHHAQKKIIERLCDLFISEVQEKSLSGILPAHYRGLLKTPEMSDDQKKRAAIDLVASMTESQAIAVYQQIEGISLRSGLDKILV